MAGSVGVPILWAHSVGVRSAALLIRLANWYHPGRARRASSRTPKHVRNLWKSEPDTRRKG
jgi:hypothetical protein